MTPVVCMHHEPPPDWDEYVARAGREGGLLQSSYWGSLMKALDRGVPLYLTAQIDEKVVALLLAIHASRPAAVKGKAGRKLTSLVSSRSMDIGDGPVIVDSTVACEAMEALLAWLAEYAGRHGVHRLRFSGFPPTAAAADDRRLVDAFTARGYARGSWATYLVDLQPETDALFMSLDHAARKGVKKAMREGIVIRACSSWDVFRDSFLLPYHAWTNGEQDPTAVVADAMRIWDHPGHHDLYRYFLAVAGDGEVLAVLGMYLFNGVATEITSGLAPAAIERKLPAQDLLHWEMFLEARRLGCHTFNLAGVAPEPGSAKEQNIRRFKKKWGGRYVEYGRFEWRHWLLRTASSLLAMVRAVFGQMAAGLARIRGQ